LAGEFNPYREWLGLTGRGRPNRYQLIGLASIEADARQIAAAAERATTRVRSFRPGANARVWAELLDEIRAAKECLCDPAKKAEYDAGLRSGQASLFEEPAAGLAETTSWMAGPTPVFEETPVATAQAYAGTDAELPMAIPLGAGGAEADMEGRIDAAAFAEPAVEPPAANEKEGAPRAGIGLFVIGLIGLALLMVAAVVYVVLLT
jgi:hypothetical protein